MLHRIHDTVYRVKDTGLQDTGIFCIVILDTDASQDTWYCIQGKGYMIQDTGISCIVILDTDTLQDTGYRVSYNYQDTDTLQDTRYSDIQ